MVLDGGRDAVEVARSKRGVNGGAISLERHDPLLELLLAKSVEREAHGEDPFRLGLKDVRVHARSGVDLVAVGRARAAVGAYGAPARLASVYDRLGRLAAPSHSHRRALWLASSRKAGVSGSKELRSTAWSTRSSSPTIMDAVVETFATEDVTSAIGTSVSMRSMSPPATDSAARIAVPTTVEDL